MKVLLTTPLDKHTNNRYPMPPLGITYIAGVLLQRGHEVRILDNYLEKTKDTEFVNIVKHFRPEVIGITCNVEDRFEAFELSKIIKENFQDIVVIFGGPFPSICHREIIEDIDSVDIVVREEGEYTLSEILINLEKDGKLSSVLGITYRENENIKVNPDRDFISNLDELPFCAFHLLKTKEYPNHLELYDLDSNSSCSMGLVFGRGCPFNCIFCSSKELWKRSYRILSPEKAVEQIEYFIKIGVDRFVFWDDHLLLDKKWFNDFVNIIQNKKLKFYFKCIARVDSIDDETAQKLKDIGCKAVYLGIENGSENVLKIMNKKINTLQSELAVKILADNGIFPLGSSLVNSPGETFEDIIENLLFFKMLEEKYNKTAQIPLSLIVFPGTDLEKIARRTGRLKDFKWTGNYYEKRNLLLGRSPYTPLYENIPTEKLVEYIIIGALKTKYYSLLQGIVYEYIIAPFKLRNGGWSRHGRYHRCAFYVYSFIKIFCQAPRKDKILFSRIILIDMFRRFMSKKIPQNT